MSLQESRLTKRLEFLRSEFEQKERWFLSKIEKSNMISIKLNNISNKLSNEINDDTFRNLYSTGIESFTETFEKGDQKAYGEFKIMNCKKAKETTIEKILKDAFEGMDVRVKVSKNKTFITIGIWF